MKRHVFCGLFISGYDRTSAISSKLQTKPSRKYLCFNKTLCACNFHTSDEMVMRPSTVINYSWVPNKRVDSISIFRFFPPYLNFFHPFHHFQAYSLKIYSFSLRPTCLLGPTFLKNLHTISTLLVYLALLV